MIGIIVLILLVVIALMLISMYNGLVQLRVRCDSAWSDIDVQLKRRHDLIPNLVETVKGYAAHEKGTFENIAKFRSQAMQASAPADKAAAENQLTGALKSLFAVAENYPELKASEQFTQLQASLTMTEESLPERAALLQLRGARSEHQDPVLPEQHSGRNGRFHFAAVLRNHRSRPRTGAGEVLRDLDEYGLAF